MEDKFGYLMKAEAEEHVNAVLLELYPTDDFGYNEMEPGLRAMDGLYLTWGGTVGWDKIVYKVRKAK